MEEKTTGLIPWVINGLKAIWARLERGDMTTVTTFVFAIAVFSLIHSGVLIWRRQSQGEELKWGEYPMTYFWFGIIALGASAFGFTLLMAGFGRATPEVILGH